MNQLYAEMETGAIEHLSGAGVAASEVQFERTADMRHVGQGFEVEVPVPAGTLSETSQQHLTDAFFATYEQLFDRRVEDVPIEVMSWRLTARAATPSLTFEFDTAGVSRTMARGQREIRLDGGEMLLADVYDRYALSSGSQLAGPAIIEERESTTLVGPDCTVRVDEWLSLIVDID